jgi:prophage regulatory protein
MSVPQLRAASAPHSSLVPRLLRPREVAALTGLEKWRVYELIRSGDLPSMRVGRCLRVSEMALADWIARSHQTGAEQ